MSRIDEIKKTYIRYLPQNRWYFSSPNQPCRVCSAQCPLHYGVDIFWKCLAHLDCQYHTGKDTPLSPVFCLWFLIKKSKKYWTLLTYYPLNQRNWELHKENTEISLNIHKYSVMCFAWAIKLKFCKRANRICCRKYFKSHFLPFTP